MRRRQDAFTLLETLLALLILSVGLLGTAAMQFRALQGAQFGYRQSLAVLAGQDAVEVLWSRLAPGGCPAPDTVAPAWTSRWQEQVSGLRGRIEATGACRYTITLTWRPGGAEGISLRAALPREVP